VGLRLDRRAFFADVTTVSNEKKSAEVKSPGTKIAEKARARANSYSDARRQNLLDKGLSIIYGGTGYAKTNRGRS
jgi:hypothetical protein